MWHKLRIIMKIIPVIHHLDNKTTMEQAEIIANSGAFGLFLISMTGENEDLPMLARSIKGKYPHLKTGINLLGVEALESVKIGMDFELDMVWSDNPIIKSLRVEQETFKISDLIKKTPFLFFNSVAFKYQQKESQPDLAAKISSDFGFIPTTSGEATGKAADIKKVEKMTSLLSKKILGIASGLTPDNIDEYIPYIEYGLVATGISKNFHEIDPVILKEIISKANG